jgi:polar amino acid transport system substrate-binding protein
VVSPVLYTQKGKGSQIQTYDDLYNYQIGYVLGSAYFEPFNSDTKLKKIGVSQEIQLVKMLASGRLEVIVGTNPNLQYDISQQGLKDKVEKTAYSPPVQTDLFVGVSKKSPLAARMNEINQAVRSLVESGEVNRIAEKYF